MGQTKSLRDKNLNRPKKKPVARRRREKVQRKRLMALGMPEDKVMKLDASAVRKLLVRPAKLMT
jgi:Fe2+ transport system protein FeoA